MVLDGVGRRVLRLILGVVLVLAVAGLGWVAMRSDIRPGDRSIRTTLSLAEALSAGDTAGYARAFAPKPFTFPNDHGPHPDFGTEWWYFTGNLRDHTGRRFGYQFTVFRSALAPSDVERSSSWATRQAFMAHFAVTDVAAGRLHAFDRFARGAVALAGATAAPFRVWLEDWIVMSDDGNETAGASDVSTRSAAPLQADGRGIFPLRLQAAQDSVAIDLVVETAKPIVLHGRNGLSAKGPEPGNASYYYSFTRLPTSGTVTVGGERFTVVGSSWWDREWSTSALRDSLAGWDWFALQLDDTTEIMAYVLRNINGTKDPFSAGTFVDANGNARALSSAQLVLEVRDTWRSPIDGTRYPSAWRLRVPALELELDVDPVVNDQELDLAVRYWEGAVTVRGRRADRQVAGQGYVELTGYARETERSIRQRR